MPAATRRWTAEERRAAVVEAAICEFAAAGLAGVSTEAIAKRAGISHAYLFKLFGSKRDLFVAAIERSFDRVQDAFASALDGAEEGDALHAFGCAYDELLADRTELLFQLQAYAACGDAEIRAVVRRRYAGLVRYVRRTAQVDAEALQGFFGQGMVRNVAVAMVAAGEDDADARAVRTLIKTKPE